MERMENDLHRTALIKMSSFGRESSKAFSRTELKQCGTECSLRRDAVFLRQRRAEHQGFIVPRASSEAAWIVRSCLDSWSVSAGERCSDVYGGGAALHAHVLIVQEEAVPVCIRGGMHGCTWG